MVEQYRRAAANWRCARIRRRRDPRRQRLPDRPVPARQHQQRTDAYGGTIENRARLLLEVVEAVRRLGRRSARHAISPVSPLQRYRRQRPATDLLLRDRAARPARSGLSARGRGRDQGPRDVAPFDMQELRRLFRGLYMANNGYDVAMAMRRGARAGRPDRVRPAVHRQSRPGASACATVRRWPSRTARRSTAGTRTDTRTTRADASGGCRMGPTATPPPSPTRTRSSWSEPGSRLSKALCGVDHVAQRLDLVAPERGRATGRNAGLSTQFARSGAPHDRIVRLLDLPLGNIIKGGIANLVPNDGSLRSSTSSKSTPTASACSPTDAW